MQDLKTRVGAEIKYIIMQREVGESGTEHVQGYVELRKKVTAAVVNRDWFHGHAHTERARGTPQQNKHYCSKPHEGCECEHCGHARTLPNNGWGNPRDLYEDGVINKPGLRSQLKAFSRAVEDRVPRYQRLEEFNSIYARYPKFEKTVMEIVSEERKYRMYEAGIKPQVVCMYGKTAVGKTRKAYDEAGCRNIHKISFETGSRGSIWFDGYELQPVLLLDDFYGQVPLSTMLRLLDWYPEPVQTKNGRITPCYEKIIITSNSEPVLWYRKMFERYPDTKEAFLRRFDEIIHVRKTTQVGARPTNKMAYNPLSKVFIPEPQDTPEV